MMLMNKTSYVGDNSGNGNMNDFKLMITCEHASNQLPEVFRSSFPGEIPSEDILNSHLGYDIGALEIYQELVAKFKPDFYCAGQFSRLYVDLNRSPRNNKSACPAAKDYHNSYWKAVENYVAQTLGSSQMDSRFKNASSSRPILHLAIHSFTPHLKGIRRNADIGILYDPSRIAERIYANVMVEEIRQKFPQFKVRRNYPYQGKTDGLCTALRKKFDPQKKGCYLGFEIEINQKLLTPKK